VFVGACDDQAVEAEVMWRLVLLLPSLALAGVTTTVTEQRFQLHDAQGSAVKELVNNQLVPVLRTTLKDCQTAGEIEFRKLSVDEAPFRCVQVTVTTYKGTCDDEPQPEDAIVGTVDENGFTIVGKLETTACVAGSANPYDIREVSWVKGSWRDKCWVKVEKPMATCDGPVAFAPDSQPEETTDEQGPWIAGTDYPYGDPCPDEAIGGCWVPSLVPTKPCPEGAEERCAKPWVPTLISTRPCLPDIPCYKP
jgi:hypothetical protein